MPGTPLPRPWWTRHPPVAGAAVMATGIVSVGLHLTGHEVLSEVVLVVACIAWLVLAAGLAMDLAVGPARERGRWATGARTADALTSATATTVLGTRFSALSWHALAEALLALAAALWAVLLILVVRQRVVRQRAEDRPTSGEVFLPCVATEGVALLCATLAGAEATAWLAHTGLVLFWLGLALYALALGRFDARQLVEGAGDHWIAGGALALAALTGAKLIAADSPRLYLWNDDDSDVLRSSTIALIALALASYVVLLGAELLRPRLRYDVRRWATVYPMGLTAAATLVVAAAVGVPWLTGTGQVLVWVAVAVWIAVVAGAVAATRARIRSRAAR
ncbi:hypothetical protein [Streptomyces sp. V3I7]|uniref:SLAC1 family transporter n=1 Tax=Streptomyces sp. V3I7 TaxID=3042278 RepID=UPI002783B9C1|nr:hypothetical protein [Streptomyces sp. V3I7]MDQ0992572.1 tellurite resistance protein TehA-like permease [Streptomyces sp. V3I7]